MSASLTIEFASLDADLPKHCLLLAATGPHLGPVGAAIDKRADGYISAAMKAAGFAGKTKQHAEMLAMGGLERLLVAGMGDATKKQAGDWVNLGGWAVGQLSNLKAPACGLVVEALPAKSDAAEVAAEIAMGAILRCYAFDKYKTSPSTDENGDNGDRRKLETLTIFTADPAAAEAAFAGRRAVAQGMIIARDLVNEPANVLGPVEFAHECEKLRELGVEVEVLAPGALEQLGMRALLAVAQGSVRPARVVVMRWLGAKSKRAKPLCFIGKGVVFDTGGISMKPAGGMEDMKGDMGGAACVTGLMAALAGRSANVNAIGIVGLVENMPSGHAQRPGDIVKSMSGQTIEVLNTDAEGRLVLADLLHYARQEFAPRFMIDLATLTGAIIVALGKEYAGLFANDDRLAADLAEAGEATGEKVWRMPLAKAYDDMINTPNADMKNIGGRNAGAVTAAQFLQRFVGDTPWAHLDVAGVAMASGKTDISRTWASGWGVRLLDHLVASRYEK